MLLNDWLTHLKVGDEVAEPYGLTVRYMKGAVKGVTSTQILTNRGRRYRRSDGLLLGSASSYTGRMYLGQWTADRERAKLAKEAHEKLLLVADRVGKSSRKFEAGLTDEAREKLIALTAQLEELLDNV